MIPNSSALRYHSLTLESLSKNRCTFSCFALYPSRTKIGSIIVSDLKLLLESNKNPEAKSSLKLDFTFSTLSSQ